MQLKELQEQNFMTNWAFFTNQKTLVQEINIFCKIKNLYSYLDFPSLINYSLRSVAVSVIKPSLPRTKSFKNTFFPYCISEWNNLTVKKKYSKSVSTLRKLIKCEKKKKTQYSQSMIHSVLNSLPALDFSLVI